MFDICLVVSGKQAADLMVYILVSHILAFRNSVSLPSRRHKLKYIELWYLLNRCDTILLLHHEGDCRHLRPSDWFCSPMTCVFVNSRLGTSLLKT